MFEFLNSKNTRVLLPNKIVDKDIKVRDLPVVSNVRQNEVPDILTTEEVVKILSEKK